jgi:hypothetical protein
MPIEWTASTESRTVDAMGVDRVSAADWQGFIGDMASAGVMAYAKIIDFSRASVEISGAEIGALARMINTLSESDGEPIGPAAFVVDSATALERLMLFDDRTAQAQRPMAIFPARQHALDWLEGLRSQ